MSRRTNSGFSLIESLVAIVLAGGGIAALITALGSTERTEALSLRSEKMQRLAVQKLDEIVATQDFNSQGGNFDDQGEPGFSWTLNDDTTSVENLEQITVTVTQDNEENVSQSVGRLFYRNPTSTTGGTGQ